MTTTENRNTKDLRRWDRAFGILVRQAREARGLSLEEVARKVGVRPATIAEYENGQSGNPPLMRFIALSQALGVAPHELVPAEPFPLEAHVQNKRASGRRQ